MKGIEHKRVQRCSAGHLFTWAPAQGWCPYCDLTQAQRMKSLTDGSEKPEPCGPECCREEHMNDYSRTVAAAVAETGSKFRLAEALAIDIPQRQPGKKSADSTEQTVAMELAEARDKIIAAGGEARDVSSLKEYRITALWVMVETSPQFRWIPGVSFGAHVEARRAGFSYEDFARFEPKTVNAVRKHMGRAPSTYGGFRDSATVEEKVEATREALSDPVVAKQLAKEITDHVAADPKLTAHVVSKRRAAQPMPEQGERPIRDYDGMVEQHVNGLSVALAAEGSGRWTPNERSEALLYFLTQILGKRQEPSGEQADFVNSKLEGLFSDVEEYLKNEVS